MEEAFHSSSNGLVVGVDWFWVERCAGWAERLVATGMADPADDLFATKFLQTGFVVDRFERRAVACINFIVQVLAMGILATSTTQSMLYGVWPFWSWRRERNISPRPYRSARVSKAAFLAGRQPRRHRQPVQLCVRTDPARPATAGARQLWDGAARVPHHAGDGGDHRCLACHRATHEGGGLAH